MVLSDLGAEVIRIERVAAAHLAGPESINHNLTRGRRSIRINLKQAAGRDLLLRLVGTADALVEGYRPGVAERLGVGPQVCMEGNPSLVYGRMTGWGQTGPYAALAGHDINYVSLSGTLSMLGSTGEPPLPPINLIADFGGGGMLLAVGVVAALLETSQSGQGQVVDAAMVDGAALLSTPFWPMIASGAWGERGHNLLDGGAWFYRTYECSDGHYIAFGSLEPQFFEEMIRLTGLADDVDGRGPGAPTERRDLLAGTSRAHGIPDQDEDPCRLVRDLGEHRRVLRSGPHRRRCSTSPAQPAAGNICRGRRLCPTGSCSPVQPDHPGHPR